MINIHVPFFGELVSILNSNVVELNTIEIEKLYTDWCKGFMDNKSILTDKRSKFLLRDTQNVPSQSCLNGIDFPTWFGGFHQKKVVILGIDPLRNETEFKKANADIRNDLIIGTPYAFHLKGFREKRTSAYWQVISEVSASNFVYVTDIYKTFFYTGNSNEVRSYDYWNKSGNDSLNNNHRKILIDELNLIDPDLIVTFGALAYRVLTNQKYCPKLSQPLSEIIKKIQHFTDPGILSAKPIKVLPLMHLSGSTRSEPLDNFFKANGIPYSDKIDKRNKAGHLYGKLINDYLINEPKTR